MGSVVSVKLSCQRNLLKTKRKVSGVSSDGPEFRVSGRVIGTRDGETRSTSFGNISGRDVG